MPTKILRLEVEGYKSLKHVVWEPGDLNVLIGPNCSGKSNLLRLLEMLSASARRELDDFIKMDGGMKSLFWDQTAKSIRIALTVDDSTDEGAGKEKRPRYELAYEFEMSSPTQWHKHQVDKESLTTRVGMTGKKDHERIELLERGHENGKFLRDDGSVASTIGAGDLTETYLAARMGADNIDQRIPDFGTHLVRFRFYYDPNTGFGSSIRMPTVARYEPTLLPNGENLINYLHTLYTENEGFKETLDSTMRAAFGSGYRGLIFPPAAEQYIQMRIKWSDLKWAQPAAVLSDGLLKFLFLASIFADPESSSLIAIDEPETGLHPSMFPIIAELAAEASESTQVVLTTHSPEFLNAFDDVTPTTTVFEWQRGETELRTLSGEKLDYWLDKYKLGELFRSGGLEAI